MKIFVYDYYDSMFKRPAHAQYINIEMVERAVYDTVNDYYTINMNTSFFYVTKSSYEKVKEVLNEKK